MTTKVIDITPHKQTMRAIRFSGYSVVEALSELVDNALDARLDGNRIEINNEIFPEHILLRDNGPGMNEETLANCIRLGFSEKKDQLGEFGLGLKTAALSLGDEFVIRTTPVNDDKIYSISWNQKSWELSYQENDNKKWTHNLTISDGAEKDEHWTEIIIKELCVKFYPNLPSRIRDILGIRFAGFIRDGDILKVNGKKAESPKTEFVDHDFPIFKKEGMSDKIEIDFNVKDKRIHGWLGIMIKRSPGKGHFGFNTFRHGRLITQYDKFCFSPHPNHANLYGELHLDDFQVTHNKRDFLRDNELFEEMKDKLSEVIKPVVKAAEEYQNKKYDAWKKGESEEVNDTQKGNNNSNSSKNDDSSSQKDKGCDHNSEDNNTIEKTETTQTHGINIKITSTDGGFDGLWKSKDTKDGLDIKIKKSVTTDQEFLKKLCIAEVLAEKKLNQNAEIKKFKELRDEIMKEIS